MEMRENLLKNWLEILSEFGIGTLVGHFRTSNHILILKIKFLVENSSSSGESSSDISRYGIPSIYFWWCISCTTIHIINKRHYLFTYLIDPSHMKLLGALINLQKSQKLQKWLDNVYSCARNAWSKINMDCW